MNPSFFLTLFTGIVLVVTTEQIQERWFIIKICTCCTNGSISHVLCKDKKRFCGKGKCKARKFF